MEFIFSAHKISVLISYIYKSIRLIPLFFKQRVYLSNFVHFLYMAQEAHALFDASFLRQHREAQGIIPYALQVTVASPYPTLAQICSMAS